MKKYIIGCVLLCTSAIAQSQSQCYGIDVSKKERRSIAGLSAVSSIRLLLTKKENVQEGQLLVSYNSLLLPSILRNDIYCEKENKNFVCNLNCDDGSFTILKHNENQITLKTSGYFQVSPHFGISCHAIDLLKGSKTLISMRKVQMEECEQ